MIPKSYRKPSHDCCRECKYCFNPPTWSEDGDYYYCTYGDKKPRPARVYGPVPEVPNHTPNKEKDTLQIIYYKWCEKREVEEFGLCNNFERRN